MAEDWIKMRMDLWDHPKVVRIVSELCPQNVQKTSASCPERVRDASEKCRVIGAMFRTWSIFDRHAVDGVLEGYDAAALDADVGIDGWAETLQYVGWLVVNEQSIAAPRFSEHNGETSKRRAEDARRKRNVRKVSAICPENVRKTPDVLRTREEKRREEKRINTEDSSEPVSRDSKPPESARESHGATHKRHEPAQPDDLQVVLEFPCVGQQEPYRLRRSKVEEYRATFPGIDVLAELRKALQWCRDNPSKRKTVRGIEAFLGRWLGKSQDRGSCSTGPSGHSANGSAVLARPRELAPSATRQVSQAELDAKLKAIREGTYVPDGG